MRRDASLRYNEPPSLGGTLGDPLQTQDDLLNTSSEAINTLPMEKHVRRLFSTADSATSPEKGRIHSCSPSVSERTHSPALTLTGRSDRAHSPMTADAAITAALSPQKQRRLRSPVKMNSNEYVFTFYLRCTVVFGGIGYFLRLTIHT